jgi:hypothetical protein
LRQYIHNALFVKGENNRNREAKSTWIYQDFCEKPVDNLNISLSGGGQQ